LHDNASEHKAASVCQFLIQKNVTTLYHTPYSPDRKQLNIFERKVYRRILGTVYDNGKENWRILTNKDTYAILKKTYHNRDNKAT
jgi:hypothetical protein